MAPQKRHSAPFDCLNTAAQVAHAHHLLHRERKSCHDRHDENDSQLERGCDCCLDPPLDVHACRGRSSQPQKCCLDSQIATQQAISALDRLPSRVSLKIPCALAQRA